MDIVDYSDRVRIEQDEVSLPLCRRLGALLDLDFDELKRGDELPFPWTAVLFPGVARQSDIGEDGHPLRGDFLPPIALPRRRFAGRSVELVKPLRIGDPVERRSTITEVTPKEGRNGPMVFVTIRHEINGPAGLAMTEHQQVVYLGPEQPINRSAVDKAPEKLPEPAWKGSFIANPVALFRYSALTFNGHRIHYDRTYATEVEGYPAMVANGGLTTLLLLEMARQRLGKSVSSYNVRAVRPLFEDQTASLYGVADTEGGLFWALNPAGELVMKIDIRTQ
ncbi:FAS1-like dehydratase domain-containing protein [Sphingomonas paeninsulae]|uniref:FAS1-like dehydratase domain-containing protein n=1 Tax=Sphingomonas paeninsulae TaxID=2319844 RepID=UPI0013CEDD90|nr:MaoC family dehydratase N-terminal domain-containing protein [Sphingomonas paeninsulae]